MPTPITTPLPTGELVELLRSTLAEALDELMDLSSRYDEALEAHPTRARCRGALREVDAWLTGQVETATRQEVLV